MASVKPPFTSMPGRAFWGLVVQKGPWKSGYSDYLRAHQVPGGAKGGGVSVGGTGEGKRDAVMTPYQQNGRNALPEPSEHATQSIVRPGESWFIKKPPAGKVRVSQLKAALAIGKTKERDYEDISHPPGEEPSMPPPDLKSTFLTEERLSRSRNKMGLTIVTRNLPRYDIVVSEVVSQPPSYSTGVPPSYHSFSGRPMSLDTPPAQRPPMGQVTPLSSRSRMSVDTIAGGGIASPMPELLSASTSLSDAMSVDTAPKSLVEEAVSEASYSPPVIDQVESNKNLDEELIKLRETMEMRKLHLDTSNLPPPARRAGMRVIGSSLEPGGMKDVANEFYPTEKRMIANAEGSGRTKKGKLTLPPKPKEPREDIITSRQAEKMKRAAEARKGALKEKFAPSNVKPKRKPDTERVAGQKRRKRDLLKIDLTQLPPSKQSSTKSSQFQPKQKTIEDKSAPKTFDQLPQVRPKRKAPAPKPKPVSKGVSKKTKKK